MILVTFDCKPESPTTQISVFISHFFIIFVRASFAKQDRGKCCVRSLYNGGSSYPYV